MFTTPGFFESKLLASLLGKYLPRVVFVEPVAANISFILEPEAAALWVLPQSLLSTGMSEDPELKVSFDGLNLSATRAMAC